MNLLFGSNFGAHPRATSWGKCGNKTEVTHFCRHAQQQCVKVNRTKQVRVNGRLSRVHGRWGGNPAREVTEASWKKVEKEEKQVVGKQEFLSW